MDKRKFKAVQLDLETHRELARFAKSTGRTMKGTVNWLLTQHTAPLKPRQSARQGEAAA